MGELASAVDRFALQNVDRHPFGRLDGGHCAIAVRLDLDSCEWPLTWSRNVSEAIRGIENSTVSRADYQFLHWIIVNGHALMGAGSFAGDELPVGQVNQQAADAIG